MRILVCNIGSSSFKFQLLDMEAEAPLARGAIERVGSHNSCLTFWSEGQGQREVERPVSSHRKAVTESLHFLTEGSVMPLSDLQEIDGVGFKCVQAGDKNGTVFLEEPVLEAMEEYRDLAPAHNPPYLEAIYRFRELLPGTPLVGVFEPGFHVDMPEHARVYGVPWDWFAEYGVRKYGYHGASHRFVAQETVRILGLPSNRHRIISCHLGGSSSLCAVQDGKSLDTSMGFSPQSGLLQGRRVGDLDPYVLPYIMRKKGISLDQALEECSTRGGLAGLSGTTGDMRDVLEKAERGSHRARLARDKFLYDIKSYLGAYLLLMGGLDAVTFTGGIGQKDAQLRQELLTALGFLGVELDADRNRRHATRITTSSSRVAALVIETNEEIVVARETARLIQDSRASGSSPF